MTSNDDNFECAITCEVDILTVRGAIRNMVTDRLQFPMLDRMQVVTVVSELARNIYVYAKKGTVSAHIITHPLSKKRGIQLIFSDEGPGIPDLNLAMKPKDITQYDKGMGVGLSGSKKLADEFNIDTEVGKGTTITWVKWERNRSS